MPCPQVLTCFDAFAEQVTRQRGGDVPCLGCTALLLSRECYHVWRTSAQIRWRSDPAWREHITTCVKIYSKRCRRLRAPALFFGTLGAQSHGDGADHFSYLSQLRLDWQVGNALQRGGIALRLCAHLLRALQHACLQLTEHAGRKLHRAQGARQEQRQHEGGQRRF